MSCFEADAKSDLYKNERNSGNYGAQTQEKQIKNYVAAKEVRLPASVRRRLPRRRCDHLRRRRLKTSNTASGAKARKPAGSRRLPAEGPWWCTAPLGGCVSDDAHLSPYPVSYVVRR
jgi:hypothetical protein